MLTSTDNDAQLSDMQILAFGITTETSSFQEVDDYQWRDYNSDLVEK